MRQTVAHRYKIAMCDVQVPDWNKKIIARFIALGGKVTQVRAN